MLVRERAAGCVSTGMCYSKNDNKDTNGLKGGNFCKIGCHRALPFSNGGVYKQRDHDNLHPILSLWRLLSLEV